MCTKYMSEPSPRYLCVLGISDRDTYKPNTSQKTREKEILKKYLRPFPVSHKAKVS